MKTPKEQQKQLSTNKELKLSESNIASNDKNKPAKFQKLQSAFCTTRTEQVKNLASLKLQQSKQTLFSSGEYFHMPTSIQLFALDNLYTSTICFNSPLAPPVITSLEMTSLHAFLNNFGFEMTKRQSDNLQHVILFNPLMNNRAMNNYTIKQLTMNLPEFNTTRKASSFFPISPNKSKLTILDKKQTNKSPRVNFLSLRKMMPPTNPETCVLIGQNMRLLRPVEIVFPTSKPSSDDKNRFPARSYIKTPAQIMMQAKQARKQTWKETLPELSVVQTIDCIDNFTCECRIPQRKIQSQSHNRPRRSLSLQNGTSTHRNNLCNNQKICELNNSNSKQFQDIRLEGWVIANNHSYYTVKPE